MKTNKLTMAAYEAPTASVIDVVTENYICVTSVNNGIGTGTITPGDGEFN